MGIMIYGKATYDELIYHVAFYFTTCIIILVITFYGNKQILV